MDPEDGTEVTVIRVQGDFEAQLLVAAFRANNIPARTHGEAIGRVFGLTLDGLGEVAILVPAAHAESARALLEAADRGQLAATGEERAGGEQTDSDPDRDTDIEGRW